MTRTEFIYFLMLNGVPKEKAEEVAKYFNFERPKGEWEEPTGIEKNLATAYGKDLYAYRCSECGLEIWTKTKPNFCERCGADMRGEE